MSPTCFRTRGTVSIGSADGISAAVVTSSSFSRRALTSTRLSNDPAAWLYAWTAPSSFRRTSSKYSVKRANLGREFYERLARFTEFARHWKSGAVAGWAL